MRLLRRRSGARRSRGQGLVEFALVLPVVAVLVVSVVEVGLIYQAMRFPTEMFCVLFAIPRMSGWIAQWQEMIEDKDQKIARPRQVYLGSGKREYVPLHRRA